MTKWMFRPFSKFLIVLESITWPTAYQRLQLSREMAFPNLSGILPNPNLFQTETPT